MVLEDPAVENRVIPLPVKHRLHIVRVLPELGLDQDKFTIGLRPGIGILRIHDDGAEHAAGDVLDHGARAAVIEKHTGLLRHEGVLVGFAR